MKTPALLFRLNAGVRRAIPASLIDDKGTFVQLDEFRALRAAMQCPVTSPAKRLDNQTFRRRVMAQVTPLIRAIWPEVGSGRGWRNTQYCPRTAMGGYIWTFQVELVQEILWLRPEFIAGFRYVVSGIEELSRDANPYPTGDHRDTSWDAGYILGLAKIHVHEGYPSIGAWLKWLESPAALPINSPTAMPE